MAKIYLLVASGGSYEDAWEKVELASKDKSKLEAEQVKREGLRDFCKEVIKQLESFVDDWNSVNVMEALEEPANVPKWPSGLDQRLITKEMKAERQSLTQFNKEVLARNHQKISEHNNKRFAAEVEYAEHLGLFDRVPKENFTQGWSVAYLLFPYLEARYEIQEVEEI